MNAEPLKDFVARGQSAQAAVDEISKEFCRKSDAEKIAAVKEELNNFLANVQGSVTTLDAIYSIVYD